MEITQAQFAQIEHCLPLQRGNVSLSNLHVLNAILYVAEHGCKWRGLPKRFGNWHTIYTRMNRWAKSGVLDRVFERVAASPDRADHDRSGLAGQHQGQGSSGWHGGVKKNGPQAIGKSRGGWTTKIHMVAADARTAITFCLSPRQAHDAAGGTQVAQQPWQAPPAAFIWSWIAPMKGMKHDNWRWTLASSRSCRPSPDRVEPWEYDRVMYKRRNEVERLFRRLKGFRRIFSRFEKLDVMFTGFIRFALIVDALRLC